MKSTLLKMVALLTLMASASLGLAQSTNTDIFTESFNSAASVEGWTPAGDAAGRASEATLEWADGLGVDASGALRMGGVNADGNGGRAYIFEKIFTNIDFGGKTNVNVSLSIKTESLAGTNVAILTDISGSVRENANVTGELTDTGFTTFTFTHESINGSANALKVLVNLAAGAATDLGGSLLVDDIKVTENDGSSSSDELLTNGDFELGNDGSWFGNALNILEEGGNNYNFANVAVAGNAFDANLSQVVPITIGQNYVLKFDASTGAGTSRTIIAGIGLNEGDFRANTQVITLADSNQTYTLNLTSTFAGANSRVLFDMGADVGVVVIDNVSLTIGEANNEVTPPSTPAPTPPARNAEDVISLFSDAYTNVNVSTFATEWSEGTTATDVEVAAGDMIKLYNLVNFAGIQLENAIDLTSFSRMHFDYWVADATVPAGAIFSPKLSNHAGLPAQAGETSAIESTNPVSTGGQWVSFDVALNDFTAAAANGILDRENIYQILLAAAGTLKTVYIDNLYFYRETGTSVGDDNLPTQFALNQNYPNPFNPTTNISYSIPTASNVSLEVFNLQGQRVASLVNGFQSSGAHSVNFDASNLSSGVYIYRLRAGNNVMMNKMTLIK